MRGVERLELKVKAISGASHIVESKAICEILSGANICFFYYEVKAELCKQN